MFSIIKTRKIWLTISATLVIASIIVFAIYGLKLGIDFTGGSLLEVEFGQNRPQNQLVSEALIGIGIENSVVQPIGDNGMSLRFKDVDEAKHQEILKTLNDKFVGDTVGQNNVLEKRFDSIGPNIGAELKKKTLWALLFVCLGIITYVAWAFRKVSKPVASWKYGLVAVLALAHDIIITVGFFVLLGKFYHLEINAPFIAALLTILGYSVNDTIVVFDRTRENLIKRAGDEFEDIIDFSINQVLVRSINTSFTVLLALFVLFIFGGSSIRDFVLALIVGVTVGTYSSLFLASPLLVVWEKMQQKK